jgi:tripartite-type tricarboxylate transporter receptor subunit TctC
MINVVTGILEEHFMKFPRRRFLHLAAGAATFPGLPSIAWAQPYPTRTVRIIVGFAAGGGNDIVARLIGGVAGRAGCGRFRARL